VRGPSRSAVAGTPAEARAHSRRPPAQPSAGQGGDQVGPERRGLAVGPVEREPRHGPSIGRSGGQPRRQQRRLAEARRRRDEGQLRFGPAQETLTQSRTSDEAASWPGDVELGIEQQACHAAPTYQPAGWRDTSRSPWFSLRAQISGRRGPTQHPDAPRGRASATRNERNRVKGHRPARCARNAIWRSEHGRSDLTTTTTGRVGAPAARPPVPGHSAPPGAPKRTGSERGPALVSASPDRSPADLRR